jgi:hypothetical protein
MHTAHGGGGSYVGGVFLRLMPDVGLRFGAAEGPEMSLSAWERQALDSIEDGLAGSDFELAALLIMFNRVAPDEEMPVREKVRPGPRRPVRCSRRIRPLLSLQRVACWSGWW